MNIFERKYCIVDNSGNYYAVNDYDTLVVAKDERVAQWFDILEANKRINNSGMAKSLRTVTANKSILNQKSSISNEANDEEFSMEDIDFSYLARELLFVQKNLQKHQADLRKKQSKVDEEISDIMHFVELYERDDEQSLDLMDKLFDCRKRRRVIKDELFLVDTFSKIFTAGGMESILKNINNQMGNMEKRDYAPRRLHSLFIQGVRLKNVEKKRDIHKNLEFGKEENNMEYERHDTIFDEKDNDWESLVLNQAEMFENIQQYVVNLKLDLDELDSEIENLMEVCEDANYNVAQGYKMFKQLKELRLLRKEKMSELSKVKAISECFDCNKMAAKYRKLADELCTEKESESNIVSLMTAERVEAQEAM